MRLELVELVEVRLPLVAPFRTSFGTQTERNALLIRATTDAGQGWGECVAMTAPVYSPEFIAAARIVIAEHLLPRLFTAPELTAETVGHLLAPIKGHRMAKAALEMAVLDAQLRAESRSLASYLGATAARIPSGVSVGIMDSIDDLVRAVGCYLEQGYVRVKLKIEPGWDVEPVRAIRAAFGNELPLQVDANTAYRLDDAPRLTRLDEFGLLLIEQPLLDEDLTQHAVLATRLRTPICLDESVESAKDAADAIALKACSVINIKAGRVGGYLEAKRIHDVAMASGVAVWCGGMLETGIGRAANIALAALPGFTLPGDTSASDRFYRKDITAPFVLQDGHMRVPTGPGLGVEIDEQALAEVTVGTTTLVPGTLGPVT